MPQCLQIDVDILRALAAVFLRVYVPAQGCSYRARALSTECMRRPEPGSVVLQSASCYPTLLPLQLSALLHLTQALRLHILLQAQQWAKMVHKRNLCPNQRARQAAAQAAEDLQPGTNYKTRHYPWESIPPESTPPVRSLGTRLRYSAALSQKIRCTHVLGSERMEAKKKHSVAHLRASGRASAPGSP